jgi:hypothetical protein
MNAQTWPTSLKPKQEKLPASLKLKENENQQVASIQEKPKETSFIQRVASSPIGQTLLGAAKVLTWPLDVIKILYTGGGLSNMREIEEAFHKAGQPFDRDEYIKSVYDYAENIPTQEMVENVIKEKTGIDLAPQGLLGKGSRKAGEILALRPSNLISSPGRAITGAVGGAGAATGLHELGVPEPIADIIGFGASGLAHIKGAPAALSKEAQTLQDISGKHGLRELQGLQRETPPAKALASPERQQKAVKELSETSKAAIDKVIEGEIPVSRLRKMGVNLEDAYNVAFSKSENQAAQLDSVGAKVKFDNSLDFIKSEINKIKKSAPSLSSTDKVVIRELKKQYKGLTNAPPPPPKTTLLGPTGQPLSVPKVGRSSKLATPTQSLDQYRNFNEEVKDIYRKPKFTGSESRIKDIYGKLNKHLIQDIEQTSPELANDLKAANKIFSQTSDLNTVEGILEKAFKDGYNPKKLANIIDNKSNKSFLTRALGKDAVKDMADIAYYGKQAEEKVFSKITAPKTIAQYATEMSPLQLLLVLGKKSVAWPLAIANTKELLPRVQGMLMLKPGLRKTYKGFLKNSIAPQSPGFKKAAIELTKAIAEEYGSEDNLLKKAQG